jgi:5-methylcytosine-specific restriction endonuclease McrA
MSDYRIPEPEVPKDDITPLYKIENRKLYSPQFTKKGVMLKRRQWLENELRLKGKCEKCPRETLLTIDHIIPIFIIKDMGFDFEQFFDVENLRLLCRPCNALKSNHLDFSTPRTKYLMRKYLGLV